LPAAARRVLEVLSTQIEQLEGAVAALECPASALMRQIERVEEGGISGPS
jgi:hypothetical protein